MTKARLEAFSDGVFAIIITIMVLELRPPEGSDSVSLMPLLPVFVSYALSFVFLGIYWSNHHHMLQAVRHVNGRVLWANLHLLFWLSLIPFTTAWMGGQYFASTPVSLYGVVLLASAIAYYILSRSLLHLHGRESTLGEALGGDFKGKISIFIYIVSIILAKFNSFAAGGLYVLVAAMWFVPDKRFEKALMK